MMHVLKHCQEALHDSKHDALKLAPASVHQWPHARPWSNTPVLAAAWLIVPPCGSPYPTYDCAARCPWHSWLWWPWPPHAPHGPATCSLMPTSPPGTCTCPPLAVAHCPTQSPQPAAAAVHIQAQTASPHSCLFGSALAFMRHLQQHSYVTSTAFCRPCRVSDKALKSSANSSAIKRLASNASASSGTSSGTPGQAVSTARTRSSNEWTNQTARTPGYPLAPCPGQFALLLKWCHHT
jgi:hypothetical protein